MIFLIAAFFALMLPAVGCAQSGGLTEAGVSWELAEYRKACIHDLVYDLHFSIPEELSRDIEGREKVVFGLSRKTDVILDFLEAEDRVHGIVANGRVCDFVVAEGHIVIPKRFVKRGRNSIEIVFTAGNEAINRREGYVYTLFVPDRARAMFPCFDQPNLKALFRLDLDIPEGWRSVTNDVVSDTPISTYLFAFAAGRFEYEEFVHPDRKIGIYHRETDSLRLAQLTDISNQVYDALKWQEGFTGIGYPFPKYDLVILPGFQFGGMEHVGATFYNDNVLFLPENPTPDERLQQSELIAHETSHMWFGDAVTMNWFDDVWTKEVFANYFAAEIAEPRFPDIDHELNWMTEYVNKAMRQDRTEGRTSIRQQLPNLRYAGLVYNDIIYNKAPVMMRKMVEVMGKEAFQRGIRRYVKRYLYDNATWDDLIEILDGETDADLREFSREWVDCTYWPRHSVGSVLDSGIGREYGYYDLTRGQCDSLFFGHDWEGDCAADRLRLMMTLNENYLDGKFGDSQWLGFLTERLKSESEPFIAQILIEYMGEPLLQSFSSGERFDVELMKLAGTHRLSSVRTLLLRMLAGKAQTAEVVDSLYGIWLENCNTLLSPNDYMKLAYELAVRMPDRADEIVGIQRSRISNPDRRAQFDFISRAVSASEAERDSLFGSLAKAENRRIEPWTLSVLYYLNHPLRQREAVRYIRPALDLLTEIQRTGDIFFPENWCDNLLAGHRSAEAYHEVESFLEDNRDMLPLLRNKILSAEYYLKRKNENASKASHSTKR